MNRFFLLAPLFIFFLSIESLSQQRRGGTQSRERTIGDILRRIEVKAQETQIDRQRTQLPQASPQRVQERRRQAEELRRVSPPSTAQLYYEEGTDESELERTTDESIEQLFRLTQRSRQSPRRGELWLRLAELYADKARLIEFRLRNQYHEALERHQAGQRRSRPQLNLSDAQEYNKRAIELYELFIRDFPTDPKMDQALFFLGYNYFALNQPRQGERYYQRLTSEFPRSPYVSESNFALGEHYFDNNNWREAQKYYQRVARDERSRLYSFALYKLAWTYYKIQQTGEGLKLLERVILEGRRAHTDADKSQFGVSRIRLATEAIRDIVIFYAEAGNPNQARSYFERVVGPRSANAQLVRLADFYRDTGSRAAAREIYRDLINSSPGSIEAFEYQHSIVKVFQASGDMPGLKNELESWVANFGPNSPWQRRNRSDEELIKQSNQKIEENLRNYILQQHQTGQKSRAATTLKLAQDSYEVYVNTFKEGPNVHEMRFFYGELLFDLNNFQKAAEQYTWVAENAPNSEYHEKALINAVLALEKGLPSNNQIQEVIGERSDPIAFPNSIKQFEEATLRYLKSEPKGENVVPIKYRLGVLYYYFNQFDPALKLFNELVKEAPRSEQAGFAANLILDIYNIREDYEGLRAAADEILKVPALARTDVGSQIQDIKLQTDFKLAQDLEKGGKFSEAAQAYSAFAAQNPNSPLTLGATYNAGVNFEKAGNLLGAISMYVATAGSRRSEDEELKKQSAKFLAPLYEKTGQYALAARSFELYANAQPNDPVAMEYHYNAALIYDGLNQYTSAIRNYQKYYDMNRTQERHDALFFMARLQERRGELDRATQLYDRFLQTNTANAAAVVEANYRIARIHASRGRTKFANEWYDKTVAVYRRLVNRGTTVGTAFAAEARYHQVRRTYDELVKINIPRNPEAQASAVSQKLNLINKLKDELRSVIAYDDGPQVVAALKLQGQSFHHMHDAIQSAPAPRGLSEAELKEYNEGIKGIVEPFRAQAVESYDASIKRGYELQAYTPELLEAIESYDQLRGVTKVQPESILTMLPDWMDLSSKELSELDKARKSGSEEALISEVSALLNKDQNHLQALNALALFYFETRRPRMARIVLQRALEGHGNVPALHNNLGVTYMQKDERRSALRSLIRSVELNERYRVGSSNLSSIYLQHRDYKRALPTLADVYRSLGRDLSRGQGWAVDLANNYGVALIGQTDFRRARSVFRSIMNTNTENPVPYLNYAILLIEHMDNKSEGMEAIKKLKALSTDSDLRRKSDVLERRAR